MDCTALSKVNTYSSSGFGYRYYGDAFKNCTAFTAAHNTVATAFELAPKLSFISASSLPFDSDIYLNIPSSSSCYTSFSSKFGTSTFVTTGHVLVDGTQVFSL
ncbi:MAG: hypothetical protein LKJ88_02735 [Bacilli bacterium]|jgi:hypothetical protein|nr:hypothetical protein [Bacilli bacterium]